MSTVQVRRSDPVRWIGLDRPDKRNALDQAMVDEIDAVLAEARRDPCVLIVHSTTPGVFAAGADIAELRERDADAALLAINAGLFERLEAHRWPTIALVDGPALGGGCELALACDLRLASEQAVFAQPESSLASWPAPARTGGCLSWLASASPAGCCTPGSASVPAMRSPQGWPPRPCCLTAKTNMTG